MFSVLAAAVFALTPLFPPAPAPVTPSTHPGVSALRVMPDRSHHGGHRRHRRAGGFVDGYYEPDDAASNTSQDIQQQDTPPIVAREVPPPSVEEETRTFPSYSTIVVKGAPSNDGCVYKGVMSDDEIDACKEAARIEARAAR